ncbi:MAG TPA: hypothetical protein VIM61_03590 [Chthoniobacterales bacterium]
MRAYREFLDSHGVPVGASFERLPPTDKESYLKRFPFRDLVGDDFDGTFTIFSSSGSSGHAFYWPQLKSSHASSATALRGMLEDAFAIHERRTLAVIGLALGSWIGGDFFSWVFKNVSVSTPYPFAVFSPGNKHDEIISILHAASGMVDQFLLVCCPSAIGHLLLRAEQSERPLPLEKMRYLVIGEPFPEFVRLDLEKRSGCDADRPVMLSVYGSADTGVLGFESRVSLHLRRICETVPAFAQSLSLQGAAPHFFHVADPSAYLESVNGELWVTKWQGIPIVRYNLHDQARILDWNDIASALTKVPADASHALITNPPPAPLQKFIAITGRSDSCLILCGTNITETMLDHALRSSDLQAELTGTYKARIVIDNGRQRLEIVAESRDARHSAELVYPRLIQAIGRAQPEFLDDWNSIYNQWDEDAARRILKLSLVPWPGLSGVGSSIKHRGIIR